MSQDKKHLCDYCELEFPTCPANDVVFGIDVDKSARGKEADRVVSCGSYCEGNGSK